MSLKRGPGPDFSPPDRPAKVHPRTVHVLTNINFEFRSSAGFRMAGGRLSRFLSPHKDIETYNPADIDFEIMNTAFKRAVGDLQISEIYCTIPTTDDAADTTRPHTYRVKNQADLTAILTRFTERGLNEWQDDQDPPLLKFKEFYDIQHGPDINNDPANEKVPAQAKVWNPLSDKPFTTMGGVEGQFDRFPTLPYLPLDVKMGATDQMRRLALSVAVPWGEKPTDLDIVPFHDFKIDTLLRRLSREFDLKPDPGAYNVYWVDPPRKKRPRMILIGTPSIPFEHVIQEIDEQRLATPKGGKAPVLTLYIRMKEEYDEAQHKIGALNRLADMIGLDNAIRAVRRQLPHNRQHVDSLVSDILPEEWGIGPPGESGDSVGKSALPTEEPEQESPKRQAPKPPRDRSPPPDGGGGSSGAPFGGGQIWFRGGGSGGGGGSARPGSTPSNRNSASQAEIPGSSSRNSKTSRGGRGGSRSRIQDPNTEPPVPSNSPSRKASVIAHDIDPAAVLLPASRPRSPDPEIAGPNVDEDEDDNFGLGKADEELDLGNVDDEAEVDQDVAEIGGMSKDDWEQCLHFFGIDGHDKPYNMLDAVYGDENAESPVPDTENDHTRASTEFPFYKLWGTTFGLYDYQLFGVFKLLRSVVNGAPGYILADPPGLGKTQQLLGVIAVAHALRLMREEVQAEWDSEKPRHHQRQGAPKGSQCPSGNKYGLRCYCVAGRLTRSIARRLPSGFNLVICPAKLVVQWIDSAKRYLAPDVFSVYNGQTNATQDGMPRNLYGELRAADIEADVDRIQEGVNTREHVNWTYVSHPDAWKFSRHVVITSRNSLVDNANSLATAHETTREIPTYKKQGALKAAKEQQRWRFDLLMPGIVALDEFHEYAKGAGTQAIKWLNQKKQFAPTEVGPPLMYFASGTPVEEGPNDIRSIISLLADDGWSDPGHAFHMANPETVVVLAKEYKGIIDRQKKGERVKRREILSYTDKRDQLLQLVMLRRQPMDRFRGRKLTTLSKMRVQTYRAEIPDEFLEDVQALSENARNAALKDVEANKKRSIEAVLRADTTGATFALRLCSTFPAVAANAKDFDFTVKELNVELKSADDDGAKTKYRPYLDHWLSVSPKMEKLRKIITRCMNDKTKRPGYGANADVHGKKICVFCPIPFEAFLTYEWLRRNMPSVGKKKVIPTLYYSGIQQTKRQAKVFHPFADLESGTTNVLVTTMQLGGTGLNLQHANYIVAVSLSWLRRDHEQAFGRAHRVGQTLPTHLYQLYSPGNPIERRIHAKHQASKVVENANAWKVARNVEPGLIQLEPQAGESEEEEGLAYGLGITRNTGAWGYGAVDEDEEDGAV